LEDIIQQDPREKLEHFPKLGYYFISFRAVDTQSVRKLSRQNRGGSSTNSGDSTLGEANVYLVVFKEGICSVGVFCPVSTIEI
jgi:magnesium transporter